VGLVASVDGDQVGGECFNLTYIAKPTGIDAVRAWYRGGEIADRGDSLAIIAQHEHAIGEVIDSRIVEEYRADVVEGGDDRGLGEDLLCLLGRGAAGDRGDFRRSSADRRERRGPRRSLAVRCLSYPRSRLSAAG